MTVIKHCHCHWLHEYLASSQDAKCFFSAFNSVFMNCDVSMDSPDLVQNCNLVLFNGITSTEFG